MQNFYRTLFLFFICPSLLLAQNDINYEKPDIGKSLPLVYVGAGINIMHFAAGGVYATNGGKDFTSLSPKVLMGITLYPNPNTQKLFFRADLSVTGGHYSANYDNKVYPYVNIDYAYKLLIVALTPQVLYNIYNSNDAKFYMGLGVTFNFNNVLSGYYKSKGTSLTTADKPYNVWGANNQIMIKTGFLFNKKFGINVAYLTPVLYTRDGYFRFVDSSLQAGLEYFFERK